MSPRWTRRLIAGVVTLAAAELVGGSLVYRDTIDPEDWVSIREAVERLPATEPVLVASAWLEPSMRMQIAAVSRTEWIARADLRGATRFHVIGYANELWSNELSGDLEGQPEPRLASVREFGPFVLATYDAPTAGRIVDQFAAAPLGVRNAKARCPKGSCSDATVHTEVVEVDYRPRQCLAIRAQDGATIHVQNPTMNTGDLLVGHIGFGDFNARLRSDAPVSLAIAIDGTTAVRLLASDSEGWKPFMIATEPGVHSVEATVEVSAGGTWQGHDYTPGQPRTICFELRTLTTTLVEGSET